MKAKFGAPRGHRSRRRGRWALLVWLFVGGCAVPSGTPPPGSAVSPPLSTEPTPAPTQAPSEALPSGAPTGTLVSVEEAIFSEDMRRLQLTFFGAPQWTGDNPECSAAYAGWTQLVDETIEVAVIETVPQGGFMTSGDADVFCVAMAARGSVIVGLREPFAGSQIRDVRGLPHPVRAEGVELWEVPRSALPPDWKRQPRIWLAAPTDQFVHQVIYSSVEFPLPDETQLVLIQSHDPGGPHPLPEATVTQVVVQGSRGLLQEWPDGSLSVSWSAPSGDLVTLSPVGWAVSAEELMEIAELAEVSSE